MSQLARVAGTRWAIEETFQTAKNETGLDHYQASFAALCGVNPIDASSGKTHRRRLNRGGDRQANSALYTITIARLRWDKHTQHYIQRRTAEGRTRREAIRCLKRYICREIYHNITAAGATPPTAHSATCHP